MTYLKIKFILFSLVLMLVVVGCLSRATKEQPNEVNRVSEETSAPVDDYEVFKKFLDKASGYYEKNGGITSDVLKKQMLSGDCNIKLFSSGQRDVPFSFYNHTKEHVLIQGNLYKCDHCPDFHLRIETAFPITEDGLCVSNYHVFKSYDPSKPNDYITSFVMDFKGEVYPVTEIIAASKQDDLCIFKIECPPSNFKPLKLGADLRTGDEVQLISHPDRRFFRLSKGHITRKYLKAGTSKIRQSISADIGTGSCGAPVFDIEGKVAGIVTGTENVYYLPGNKGYQMTVKEIVPVSQLLKLINTPSN
ncbi:S1 family peptidase [Carboxylicivirga marina]|uniref:Trypsin-like peptidase domain-containing protein n=1 Tax=Carboxylicivirga marina TaxID=2800988 RepID=A0ABS1HH54_9BACT|nr:serine protease [Carboxylicivirga marina]MBK3516993.1 trypsin-like peptidase domain-containing protein [Carboxylicivirga marina]